jgi:hypothetical protein
MSAPRNDYKVPAKKWRRWSATARRVFNQVCHDLDGAWEMLAPGDELPTVKPRARRVFAFNAAWIAADAANGDE